ncbi:MarR family transcriptional regulator [Mycetocola manganoxydans]|uniref:MarR family transcriptional regulator n=1 Tax=Mycetocola manganoxydans TaxID=699879 RepID=A0A3L7A1U5_9MICO|nr:helix-turn-helix domain-containing protein [Mycetocola manganoxydans]RLP73945.1 MarR family transcriptional regulator [Mycetocola manganoxydans]GHD42203.1 transcriptional regulator [Mycetocola manganoxydans]
MATDAGSQAGSQTLSRGIRLLEILAATGRNLSIGELASELGVHRSVAYRLLRTLEAHDLVTRDDGGLVALGAGLAALTSGVAQNLQQAALPVLNEIADELGMTCLLAVRLDSGEAVTLVSAMPRQSVAVVSYRPGHRHPTSRGGPGKAILLGVPESAWPDDVSDDLRAELVESRARGYASSSDEVVPSLKSVAVPLTLPGQPAASIAVIHVALPRPEAEIAERLRAGADSVRRAYGR